jgi:hypothetical protein
LAVLVAPIPVADRSSGRWKSSSHSAVASVRRKSSNQVLVVAVVGLGVAPGTGDGEKKRVGMIYDARQRLFYPSVEGWPKKGLKSATSSCSIHA